MTTPLVLPPPEPSTWLVAGTYRHARSHQADAPNAIPISPAVVCRTMIGSTRDRLVVCRASLRTADPDIIQELWDVIDTHRSKITWLNCERP